MCVCVSDVCVCVCVHRPQDASGPSVQSLSMSDSHLAELDGDTLHLFGPGALETLERCWSVQTAASVTAVAFRYIHFDSIIPMFLRIRLKFPNLTVSITASHKQPAYH